MSTIKLPGIGTVPKGAAVAGIGLTAGILAYAYYRRSHSTGSAPGTDTSGTPADSGDSIDPSTGLPYNQESGGTGYGLPGYGGYSSGGYSPYDYYYGSSSSSSSTTYTTNLDWEEAATSALADEGVSTATSSAAISRVLAGLGVTTAQKEIMLKAVGLLGAPPNGYPTPIHVVDSAAQPAGGSTAVSKPGWAYGGHASSISATSIRIDWNDVKGATGYHLYKNGARITSTATSVFTFAGLKPNTSYTFAITPYNSAGVGPTSHVTARTHKK
jgi:hypothetical protein